MDNFQVREHRHELIKFMKEVRSRDPARRMVLRYDKLYMVCTTLNLILAPKFKSCLLLKDNDVFFFNDRSNRVEKLHNSMDAGGGNRDSLGNLFVNDSQVRVRFHWGPYLNDVYTIFGILDPLPPPLSALWPDT